MSVLPSPRFDTTINYGHILTVVTLAITLGGGLLMSAREQALLTARLTTLEKTTQVEVEKIKAEAASRMAQYAPMLSAFAKSQDLQDERIANVVDAVKEIRSNFNTSTSTLNEIRQDVAVMRVQMGVPSPNQSRSTTRVN